MGPSNASYHHLDPANLQETARRQVDPTRLCPSRRKIQRFLQMLTTVAGYLSHSSKMLVPAVTCIYPLMNFATILELTAPRTLVIECTVA